MKVNPCTALFRALITHMMETSDDTHPSNEPLITMAVAGLTFFRFCATNLPTYTMHMKYRAVKTAVAMLMKGCLRVHPRLLLLAMQSTWRHHRAFLIRLAQLYGSLPVAVCTLLLLGQL